MFNEIGAFIQKYYIDAVLEDQPYNIYLTITCAILLLVTLYLLYRWARANNIRVDTQLILASMPFVIFGGVLREYSGLWRIPDLSPSHGGCCLLHLQSFSWCCCTRFSFWYSPAPWKITGLSPPIQNRISGLVSYQILRV